MTFSLQLLNRTYVTRTVRTYPFYTYEEREKGKGPKLPTLYWMGKIMDALFRLLCRHFRTIWLRARTLFFSIRFRLLRISPSPNSSPNTSTTHTDPPPTPIPASSSAIHMRTITTFSTAKTKVCQWACTRARDFKAQMTGRSVTRKSIMMKRTAYARIAARVVGRQLKSEEGHGIAATGKYCAKETDDDDDDDEANEEEDRVGTAAQGDDDLDAFEALFKPLSSSPTLRFVAGQRSRSPFAPSLSLLSPASTPELSTPDLLVPDPWLELEPGYAHVLPSPMISCASLGSDTSSAPATPTTSQGSSFPFPGICTIDEIEVAHAKPRLHLRPNPRPRNQFRTLSASITARSPLSLSFPLSLSLPLSTRRASSPGTAVNRYIVKQNRQDEDRVVKRGRTGAGGAVTGGPEDGNDVVDGEDPFGTHGRAYYTPRARKALGFGDAYDLSAWEWACDYSPCRKAKKVEEEKRHIRVQQKQWGAHFGPATMAASGTTTPAFAFVDASIASGNTLGGTGPGSWSVYRTPIHAASDPQLSCARRPDEDLEYLRAMAKGTARGRVVNPHAPVHPGPSTRDPRDHQHASGYRSGIRPLLLPQKLGLPGSSMPIRTRASHTHLSGELGWPTGWERDLECGVSGKGDGARA